MRRTFGFALGLAVFALALGCGKKDSATSGGGGAAKPTTLEGGWTVVALELGGLKDDGKQPMKFQATADKLVSSQNGKEKTFTYKLDPSKTPNEIEMTEAKDGKTGTMYGIYKLEGDTLTICVAMSDKVEDRPKEFKTKDLPVMMMTLKKD